MNEGIVKVFDVLKGFGFITRPSGKELFFHWTDLDSKYKDAGITTGVPVAFELDPSKANRARNVKIIT